jgi:hypothetical protein
MPRGGKRPGAGRPAGQPNRDTAARRAALADLLDGHVQSAVAALADIAAHGTSEAARVSAAAAILDRVYGRPAQGLDIDNKLAMPQVITIRAAAPLDLARLSDAALAEIATLQDAHKPG